VCMTMPQTVWTKVMTSHHPYLHPKACANWDNWLTGQTWVSISSLLTHLPKHRTWHPISTRTSLHSLFACCILCLSSLYLWRRQTDKIFFGYQLCQMVKRWKKYHFEEHGPGSPRTFYYAVSLWKLQIRQTDIITNIWRFWTMYLFH
jgi:hypothetical protein